MSRAFRYAAEIWGGIVDSVIYTDTDLHQSSSSHGLIAYPSKV